MPQADRDYLAAYVRAQPSRAKDESLEDYLKRVKVDPGAPDKSSDTTPMPQQPTQGMPQGTPQEQARLRANAQRAQDKALADAKLDAADQQRKQAAKNSILIGKGLYAAGILPNAAADRVERARNWLANLPTPGGNGALLLVLLGFVAFIVPVSGAYTRAQLFWLSLLGRTSLTDTGAPAETVTHPGSSVAADTVTTRPAGAPAEPVVRPTALPFTLPLPGASGPTLPSSLS
jgi:hypothetical protein